MPRSVKVGYEISFASYFYQPLPLRPPQEIWADIRAPERESEGLLREIMGGMYSFPLLTRASPIKRQAVSREAQREAMRTRILTIGETRLPAISTLLTGNRVDI